MEGLTHTADAAFNYMIGSKTLAPGITLVVVKKISYALAPSATAPLLVLDPIALHAGNRVRQF